MIKTTNLRDSYRFYRATCEQICLSKEYLTIVNGLMQFIINKILEGNDVKLGAKLGIIGVRGKKITPYINEDGEIKGLAPNWGETKKLQARDPIAKEKKTIVYCFNEHSNGIKYSFLWAKKNVIIANKNFYGLQFARANRRELSRLVTEEHREYLLSEKSK